MGPIPWGGWQGLVHIYTHTHIYIYIYTYYMGGFFIQLFGAFGLVQQIGTAIFTRPDRPDIMLLLGLSVNT